jgi:nicotinamidase/pyrazinamidase
MFRSRAAPAGGRTAPGTSPGPGDALIVVDVQDDFLPGGRLPVPAGDEVVPALNRWLAAFSTAKLPVFATRDWHPPGHCSFRERGGPWPAHCVVGTPGARFAAGLELPAATRVISKGVLPDHDAYSGFDGTDLAARLRGLGARRLFVGGLATDYCVLSTVTDALAAGFDVFWLEDAVRPIEARPGDSRRAEEAMRRLGARPLRWAAAAS